MQSTVLKRFDSPDETRTFEKGRFEVVRMGTMTVGRASYEPGWKWSEHCDEPYVSLHFVGADQYAHGASEE